MTPQRVAHPLAAVNPRGPISPSVLAALMTCERGDALRLRRLSEARAVEIAELAGGAPDKWSAILAELTYLGENDGEVS